MDTSQTLSAICKEVGTIILLGRDKLDWDGESCTSGGLQEFSIKSALRLHEVAHGYSKVCRPDGKIESGKNYRLRKAQNDWKHCMP